MNQAERSHRVEEEIREEAVEFDQDASRDGEPDRRKHRGSGEEFFHCRLESREELMDE